MTNAPDLRFFNTGEVAIHYGEWSPDRSDGEPACLFVHGMTGHLAAWSDIREPIRNGSRAVAVDLRGHGRSGRAPGAYRLIDYARDLASLIDSLDLAPVNVISHSLGALVTLQLAAVSPELVRLIVLEDPPIFAQRIVEEIEPERREQWKEAAMFAGSGLSFDEMAEQIRASVPDATEEEIRSYARARFETDSDVMQHAYDLRVADSSEIEDALRAVRCPTLLLRGNFELGGWIPEDDGVRAQELIPDCTLEAWEDTGHLLHDDHPERFVEQVRAFVDRHAIGVRPT